MAEHLNKAYFKALRRERMCDFRDTGGFFLNPVELQRLSKLNDEANKDTFEIAAGKVSKGGHMQIFWCLSQYTECGIRIVARFIKM